jgi:MoxR-like ATPase
MLRDHLQGILSGYVHARKSTPFNKENPIAKMFRALIEEFAVSDVLGHFPNIRVKGSYGAGNWSAVPWIAFLDQRETNSTQRGVYPVILFSEDMKGFALCLSQGVTDILDAHGQRDSKTILTERAEKLRSYCAPLTQRDFILDTPNFNLGKHYEIATAAFKYYTTSTVPSDTGLLNDLTSMLEIYEKYLSDKTQGDELGEIQGDICLIGAGASDPEGRQRQKAYIAQYGALASWWSYPIAENIQRKLRKPFFLYVSEQGRGIATRLTVADYVTARGQGQKSPWPELTLEDQRDHTQFGDKASELAKTWFKVIEVEELDSPLNVNDFEPITVPNRASNKLILRNGFGYAIRKEVENMVRESAPQTKPYSIDDAVDGLFIEHKQFSAMVATFTQKKNVILQGAPGVGKTFIAKRLAYATIGENAPDRVEMIQFHQSYAYEDFIQGYRPTGGSFDLRNGIFFDFCIRATKDPAHKYVFVIDEINRGNLSKIFGELMMLVESDKREKKWGIHLTYQDRTEPKFYVPDNVHLLGLMNTADRSIAMVDYALRRRFAFIDLEPGFATEAFRQHLSGAGANTPLIDKVVNRMQHLNAKIAADKTNLGPGFRIGHSFFCASNNAPFNEAWYERVIHTEIAPLIREYWFDDTEQADAEIKQLLSV